MDNTLFICQVEISTRNRNLDQKSKFGSEIKIWIKNQYLDQKSKFGSEIKFDVNFDF